MDETAAACISDSRKVILKENNIGNYLNIVQF